MPIPTFTGLKPYPEFQDLVNKINTFAKELSNLMLNLDSLNVVSLTADHIDAGTINANLVTIRGENGDKYYRIDGSGIVANNGTDDTLKFDLATGDLSIKGIITALAGLIGGWTIQNNALVSDPNTYPRVVMDPSGREFTFYASATDYVRIGAYSNTNRPFFMFANSSNRVIIDLDNSAWNIRVDGTPTDYRVAAGRDLYLDGRDIYLDNGTGRRTYVNFDELEDPGSGVDLETALDGKEDLISGYSGNVVVGDGAGGTKTLRYDNGILKGVL